jgi:hypothetical protein
MIAEGSRPAITPLRIKELYPVSRRFEEFLVDHLDRRIEAGILGERVFAVSIPILARSADGLECEFVNGCIVRFEEVPT